MNPVQYIICLVDDDTIYHFTARKTLESTGLAKRIQSFYNGGDALVYLSDTNNNHADALPDVIFLDINMPAMNGWEFLEASRHLFKSLNKTIRVYVVSSSVDNADILRSKEYEAVTGYIVKPVSRAKYRELLDTLQAGG